RLRGWRSAQGRRSGRNTFPSPYGAWTGGIEDPALGADLACPITFPAGVLPLGAWAPSYDTALELRIADHRRGGPQIGSDPERQLCRCCPGWWPGRVRVRRAARCPGIALYRPPMASLRRHGSRPAVLGRPPARNGRRWV